MKQLLKKFIEILFPIVRFISANRKINKRISSIDKGEYTNNLLYINDFQKYSYDEISPFFEKTIEIKKTLEDKAKISAVGITIATSIIVGLSGLLLNLNIDIKQLTIFNIILVMLCVLVILYINISGILALLVIGNKNKVYQLFPEDCKLKKKEQAKYLAIYTEQNANLNIIRQNYVYSSFIHLIYSVVILSFIFILVTFDFNGKDNTKIDLIELSERVSFFIDANEKYNKETRQTIFTLKTDLSNCKSKIQYIEKNINEISIDLEKIQKENIEKLHNKALQRIEPAAEGVGSSR